MMTTSRLLLLFLVLFYTTATSNSSEVFKTDVGRSTQITKTIHVNFRKSYTRTPNVNAWAKGNPKYSDTFLTIVSNVDKNGFDATIRRNDAIGRWGQNPILYWTETPSLDVFKTNVWRSTGDTKTIRVNLRNSYTSTPIVNAWTKGGPQYPDTFRTTVSNVDTNGFDATIKRTDSSGHWGQNPLLYWTETPSEDVIKTDVGRSSKNTKTIHVDLRNSYTSPPIVNAWTKGGPQYPDTFETTVSNVDTTGFDATIKRTDCNCGWGQYPLLYWTETPTEDGRIKGLETKTSEMDKVQQRLRVRTCGPLQLPSEISDNQLTASSSYFPPRWARLYGTAGTGSWKPYKNTAGSWIQVQLNQVETIFAIATQGSYKYDEWTTSYSVSYGLDGKIFYEVEDRSGAAMIFRGNMDRNTVVLNDLPTPISALYVRILPVTYKKFMMLRFDVITC